MSAKKPRNNCRACGLLLNRPEKVYCNRACQQEFFFQDFICRWRCGEVDGGQVDGSVSEYIKRFLREKYNNQCALCKWDKINPVTNRVPLEVEHIDGDSKNSSENNLTLICPNCHSLTPTYRNLNRGNGRTYRKKRYISASVA